MRDAREDALFIRCFELVVVVVVARWGVRSEIVSGIPEKERQRCAEKHDNEMGIRNDGWRMRDFFLFLA